jgi:apolipoprotein N-acyltransferase
LLALSFPKHGHPACAWIALTPLVIAAWHAPTLRRAFGLGLLAGAVYFWGTLYWLIETMTTFGGLSTIVAVFAAAVLVAYLSLFPAAFAVILARTRQAFGDRALALVPAIWVTTELGRQYVWDGFPWALLGYSQVTVLPVAQIASIVGVYGLSALLAFTAAGAAAIVLFTGRARVIYPAAALAGVVACVIWGQMRLNASPLLQSGEPVRVAVLQGNIAQEEKWEPANRDAISSKYLRMTREALAAGATFIIWPESSTPFYFEHDLARGGAIRRLASEAGATLLIGSDQVEPLKAVEADVKDQYRYYNAAFLVKPDGQTGAIYRKMHLVPFGEYVPLKDLLFFVGPIVEAVSAFTPGSDPVLLPVGNHLASTAICYEVIFPSLIRRFVQNGSELLTTITNDAWYGRSSAAYQHWEQAAMRSIEQGRYLARAANTGISGFVDPYCRQVEKSDLFADDLLVADLRFIKERTIYNRIGDLVAWLSLVVTVAGLIASIRIKRG